MCSRIKNDEKWTLRTGILLQKESANIVDGTWMSLI
jgi:hypothetical protein